MERRHITFRGRVQGVGFRATTRAVAAGRPLSGWVRNEPDGSVLVQVQGPGPAIDEFLAALRARMARNITAEDAHAGVVIGDETGFEIRR